MIAKNKSCLLPSLQIKNIWFLSSDLGQQTVRGILLFATRFVIKLIQFARTIVLARLLFPADFGLFGLAVMVMAFADTFFQTGFDQALVHEKKDVTPYLDTAWTVNIIRYSLIAVLLFAGAPLAGAFFDNQTIVPFVQAMSLSLFLTGFVNIGVSLFNKNMEFNRRFVLEVLIVVGEVAVTIVAALLLKNVWALIIGAITGRLIAVILSFILHPYRPRFTVNMAAARHLLYYGKWVGLASIIAFVSTQGDYFTIGKLLTPADLGFYQLAFGLALLPAVEFARAPGALFIALFSKMQDDVVFLRRAFVKIASLVAMVALPASAGLWWVADLVVRYVYGEKWLPMLTVITPLILFGLVKAVEYIITPLFLGIGRPKLVAMAQSAQLVVMALVLIPLTMALGIRGTAIAMVFAGLTTTLVLTIALRRQIRIGLWGLLEIVWLPFFGSALMIGLMSLVWEPIFTIFDFSVCNMFSLWS